MIRRQPQSPHLDPTQLPEYGKGIFSTASAFTSQLVENYLTVLLYLGSRENGAQHQTFCAYKHIELGI